MKFLYKITLFVVLSFSVPALFAQNGLWSDAPETNMRNTGLQRLIVPNKYRTITLDTLLLKQTLKSAPLEFTEAAKNAAIVLSIPMPDGKTQHFAVVESPMMEPGLSKKYPHFKTYSGQGLEDKTATIKIDWTDLGFRAMILSATEGQFYVDPYSKGDKLNYISYHRSDLTPRGLKQEGQIEEMSGQINQFRTDAGFCVGSQLRTYRFAVACTGEYGALFGGVSGALSAIVNTVNRVNGVYEKEASVRLVLIANNDQIIYTNGATDPYTQTSVNSTLLNQNQTNIDFTIGSGAYDIGHLVCTIDGGGLAGLGVVCSSSNKARGATGSANPTGDAYDIDYVAHEVGHQFGGTHTFNSVTGSCSGGNRSGGTAVEPGSGVTIMAYAGICGADNIANNSIPFFHSLSLNQIGSFTNVGGGNSCAVITNTGNSAPVVNAGLDYTIPVGTPFALTGSATDANNDALTYSWEQIDLGAFGATWNSGSSPFFRSFSPTLTPTRFFPRLSDVVNNTTTIGEFMPTFDQTLNFRLTVRDNRNGGGGVCSDEMVLNLSSASAPFTVTSQPTATNWTANGTNTATITWNVAGTTAAPFNTANVSILFSADGGQTFPYTLLASTANDGTENIVIPSITTGSGRIMVRAIGNIFFNINGGNITIASSCSAEGAVVAPAANVSAVAGSASLNLGLSPQYTAPLNIAGTLVSTDPSANLAIFNVGGVGCISAGNVFRYQSFTFTPSISASYTFTRGAGTSTSIITNLYNGSFNSAAVCTNFLASNGTYTGSAVSIANSFTINLTAGNVYVLNVGTFNTGSPALPSTFSVTVASSPAGGVLNSGGGSYNNPGASFSYNYVIVNNNTNNIVAISNSANLSNAGTYPSGTYTVYGLSFANSIAGSLAAYVGGSFTALANQIQNNPASFCANLSKNAVTVSISPILPVNFIALKARKQGTKVLLEWGTASEQNSSYFSVQRSSNGVDFNKEISKVNAAGNSNSVINYSAIDAQPNSGWSYYRIKQFDLDGKFSYSNVAAINFDKSGNLVIIYPNPAKDKLNMEYTTEKSGKIHIQVIDSKGAVVLNNNMAVSAGRNISSINISAIAQGVYALKCIDADGNSTITKFIKQ